MMDKAPVLPGSKGEETKDRDGHLFKRITGKDTFMYVRAAAAHNDHIIKRAAPGGPLFFTTHMLLLMFPAHILNGSALLFVVSFGKVYICYPFALKPSGMHLN
jgi:hypothetical protein